MISNDCTFEQTLQNIEIVIKKIIHCSRWFSCLRVDNELVHILNGLRQIWLDNNLLKSSTTLLDQQDPRILSTSRENLMRILSITRIFLDDYMNKFDIIKYRELQYDKKAALENWALISLNSIRQELELHINTSTKRIQDFSDDMGVSDRYNGYRKNLIRHGPPSVTGGPDWMKKLEIPMKDTDNILLDHHSRQLQRHIIVGNAKDLYYESLGSLPQTHSPFLVAAGYGSAFKENPIKKLNAAVEKPTAALGSKLRTASTYLPQLTTRGYLTIDSIYPSETVEVSNRLPIYCNDIDDNKYHRIFKEINNVKPAYGDYKKPQTDEEILRAAQYAAGMEPVLSYKSEYKAGFGKPLLTVPSYY